MTTPAWGLLALLVVCALAGYLSATAQRLDRLHHRVETSRAGLEVELTRRASAALELATSGQLDPATSLILADAATASLDAPRTPAALRDATDATDAARWSAESGLSRALAVVLPLQEPDDPSSGAAATGRVGDAAHRVELARRFHNDAVVQTRRLRAGRRVRWARLAGHARLPETADFDDGSSGGGS